MGEVDAMGVALAALRLGAGRAKASDAVNHAVGVSGLVKIGERVEIGAPLAMIHAEGEAELAEAQGMLERVIGIGDGAVSATRLIEEWIG